MVAFSEVYFLMTRPAEKKKENKLEEALKLDSEAAASDLQAILSATCFSRALMAWHDHLKISDLSKRSYFP